MWLPVLGLGSERRAGCRPLRLVQASAQRVSIGPPVLQFSCNPVFCACQGDADCNDMFTSGVCGGRAICINDVCFCDRPVFTPT